MNISDFNLVGRMDQIDGVLYLGAIEATEDPEELRRADITTILSVISDEMEAKDRIGGIRYHWIQADDSPHEDLLTHFPEAYDIIDKCVVSGTGILVHCVAERQKTYEEIHALVQCRRPIIWPNHGFVAQLGLWEGMGF
ncbi:unnamed protein product, partial [Oppiella nova]